MANARGLLVKVAGDGTSFAAGSRPSLVAAGLDVEPILTIPAASAERGMAAAGPALSTWLRVFGDASAEINPWDGAHALVGDGTPFSAAAAQGIQAIEPDFEQRWPTEPRTSDTGSAGLAPSIACRFEDQDRSGGKALGPCVAWNLEEAYGQLDGARDAVADGRLEKIIVAHLDTGYDLAHVTAPAHLRHDWQRNFVRGGDPADARDLIPPGQELANRGHGTATLALLAGNKLDGSSPHWDDYADYVGGAPLAQVIPIRIADWVVRFTTGTMVEGIGYARERGAHVLSMSMGGLASQALADAVNLAYDSGLVMVTAAGNNYALVPSPKSIVFPARFERVLAACGVMADGRPYTGLAAGTMQGNYGPGSKMATAIGAYTPNVPWARIGCGKLVDMDGAGTSAATPQVAAAATLWLAENWDAVSTYPEPWMRIEAVKAALFASTARSTAAMSASETFEKVGQGIVRAKDALSQRPLSVAELVAHKLPPASATWAWLQVVVGTGLGVATDASGARRAMLALELTQMAQRVARIDQAVPDSGRSSDEIGPAARNSYLEAALDLGEPSKPLRSLLEGLLGRRAAPVASVPDASVLDGSPSPSRRAARRPATPERRLRIYALDPSIAKNLASFSVNETVVSIPWDDLPATRQALRPGPVGEYLEVVDVDPASDRIYDPVDLNSKLILAQDGWPPSEGNPEFHQQMVYAVGMATIRNFEQALGRRALWAPRYANVTDPNGDVRSKGYEVERLRIYPHAFRADNAYYSPEKKALLFGYFPSKSRNEDATAPGAMVFSCLSSDIVAHEMSHALLDGLHRRFQDASNLDVPAFHEGFADIVALFQHFTMVELVRFEIGRARGDLSAARFLGGLAEQFGEGSKRGGPLRDYLDPAVALLSYEDTREAHERGSILVFAVYDAFRAIVARRTSDLVRLASSGTGVLAQGALHPDLVERLTTETCKTAKHVLHMCIRALDYMPAVDITFGEYLRGLITADLDLVPIDKHGYRVAFMEAFRRRGILPRGVRTISEESLAWDTLEDSRPPWLPQILKDVDLGWNQEISRSRAFALNEDNRWSVWRALKRIFATDRSLYRQFGLLPDLPRYKQDGSVAKEPAAGDSTFDVFGVRPARRVGPDGSFRTDVIATVHQRRPVLLPERNSFFWFRGGATLVIDPREGQEAIRYAIIKNIDSPSRQERQRRIASGSYGSPLQRLYFGRDVSEPFAIMHAEQRGAGND